MGATKNIQNVREVDATNSAYRRAIDSAGRAAIQNPPNLDAAISTLATAANQVTLLSYVDGIEGLLGSIDADTGNLDIALSALRDAIVGSGPKTLTDLETKLTEIDTVLDAIKDTAGIKKITDALPAGSNLIGKVRLRNPGDTADLGDASNPVRVDPTDTTKQSVKLYDHNGNALSVQDGVALPANNDHLLIGGVHDTDGKTYHARVVDDTDTAALKRLLVEAAIKPGSSISTTPSPSALTQTISSYCKNGGSKDLNVDGSSTAVEFAYNAHGTKDIWLNEVRFILNCDALPMKGEDFGSDGTLTNGVKFEVRSNSITTELANFTINEDFLALPARSAITTIYDGPAGDQLIASFYFGGAVTLVGGSGDFVKVTVRDDIRYSSAHKTKLFWAAVYGIQEE